jgi:hypothetical protein
MYALSLQFDSRNQKQKAQFLYKVENATRAKKLTSIILRYFKFIDDFLEAVVTASTGCPPAVIFYAPTSYIS